MPPDTLTRTGPPATTDREVGYTPARDLEADPGSESASKRATLLNGRLGNAVWFSCMEERRAVKPSVVEGNVRRVTKSVILRRRVRHAP